MGLGSGTVVFIPSTSPKEVFAPSRTTWGALLAHRPVGAPCGKRRVNPLLQAQEGLRDGWADRSQSWLPTHQWAGPTSCSRRTLAGPQRPHGHGPDSRTCVLRHMGGAHCREAPSPHHRTYCPAEADREGPASRPVPWVGRAWWADRARCRRRWRSGGAGRTWFQKAWHPPTGDSVGMQPPGLGWHLTGGHGVAPAGRELSEEELGTSNPQNPGWAPSCMDLFADPRGA